MRGADRIRILTITLAPASKIAATIKLTSNGHPYTTSKKIPATFQEYTFQFLSSIDSLDIAGSASGNGCLRSYSERLSAGSEFILIPVSPVLDHTVAISILKNNQPCAS